MRILSLILPCLLAGSPGEEVDDLPESVRRDCDVIPASSGLIHMRCGSERLLVVQPRTVEGSVHDEVLGSLVEMVPSPSTRTEAVMAGTELRQTIVSQRVDPARPGAPRVRLTLTSRASGGHAVACLFAQTGKRRPDRSEQAWCERMTAALLPAEVAPPVTQVEVDEPDLPDEDFSG